MTIVNEVCPWCRRKIQVSYGLRTCPKCHKGIRVFPDAEAAVGELVRISLKEVGLGKLLKGLLW